MKKGLLLAAAFVSLGFASCESPAEKQAKLEQAVVDYSKEKALRLAIHDTRYFLEKFFVEHHPLQVNFESFDSEAEIFVQYTLESDFINNHNNDYVNNDSLKYNYFSFVFDMTFHGNPISGVVFLRQSKVDPTNIKFIPRAMEQGDWMELTFASWEQMDKMQAYESQQ